MRPTDRLPLERFLASPACAAVPGKENAVKVPSRGFMKCLSVQLGQHMWASPTDTWDGLPHKDRRPVGPRGSWELKHWDYALYDEATWRRITWYAAAKGINMIQLDVAEAVTYPSHPELGVKNGWDADKVRQEVYRLREMGIELVPALNFSATHDAWLGEYSRMVSSPRYYEVCSEIIADAIEMFDHPRLVNIGFDEENAWLQRHQNFAVIRQGDLWWHDFNWFVGEIEKGGARAWTSSDYCWTHREEFVRRMPKSVLQTNWYYESEFDPAKMTHPEYITTYDVLEKAGFDQMPCGGNHVRAENMGRTVRYCSERIAPERLKGFMAAVWRYVLPCFEWRFFAAIDQLTDALI